MPSQPEPVTPALRPVPSLASQSDTWGAQAARVAEDLLWRAELTSTGWRWAIVEVDEAGRRSTGHGLDVYSGQAGVLLFLADLHRTAPHPALREALVQGGSALRSAAMSSRSLNGGLYSGWAGLGQTYLALAEALGEASWVEEAVAAGARVEALPNASLDLISGVTGEGLFFLALHAKTGNARWLTAARARGDILLRHAIPEAGGLKWPMAVGSPWIYTGLSHGTAGTGYFLARLAQAVEAKDATPYRDSALAAGRYLRAVARTQAGAVAWHRREPDQLHQEQVQWCHGPPGIGLFFLALHSLTGAAEDLEWAEKSGEATHAFGARLGSCLCHGTPGNAALFLALHRRTGAAVWRERAEAFARPTWENRTMVDGRPRWLSVDGTNSFNPGLMVGAAGVGHLFLQLAHPDAVRMPLTD
jgi:lantibiotic modifying enzyme